MRASGCYDGAGAMSNRGFETGEGIFGMCEEEIDIDVVWRERQGRVGTTVARRNKGLKRCWSSEGSETVKMKCSSVVIHVTKRCDATRAFRLSGGVSAVGLQASVRQEPIRQGMAANVSLHTKTLDPLSASYFLQLCYLSKGSCGTRFRYTRIAGLSSSV